MSNKVTAWDKVKVVEFPELQGITIEVEREGSDYTARALILRDATGTVLRLTGTGTYENGLYAWQPAKPKTVTRYMVEGEIAGVRIQPRGPFAEMHKANEARREIERASSDADVSVTEAQLPEETPCV